MICSRAAIDLALSMGVEVKLLTGDHGSVAKVRNSVRVRARCVLVCMCAVRVCVAGCICVYVCVCACVCQRLWACLLLRVPAAVRRTHTTRSPVLPRRRRAAPLAWARCA